MTQKLRLSVSRSVLRDSGLGLRVNLQQIEVELNVGATSSCACSSTIDTTALQILQAGLFRDQVDSNTLNPKP